jgi:tetratricopeptide (TPR) repeat protein
VGATGITLLLSLTLSVAGEHLLAGADHFRAGRYADAVVEFRVAERQGAAEASAYVGASLLKLGRPEDAVEAFATAPATGDPLLEYYRALACHEARLYVCADEILSGIGGRAGPRIAAEVARLRVGVAAALRDEPERATVEWYRNRCTVLRAAGRPALAGAFCREASGLGARRHDRYGAEAAAARPAGGAAAEARR